MELRGGTYALFSSRRVRICNCAVKNVCKVAHPVDSCVTLSNVQWCLCPWPFSAVAVRRMQSSINKYTKKIHKENLPRHQRYVSSPDCLHSSHLAFKLSLSDPISESAKSVSEVFSSRAACTSMTNVAHRSTPDELLEASYSARELLSSCAALLSKAELDAILTRMLSTTRIVVRSCFAEHLAQQGMSTAEEETGSTGTQFGLVGGACSKSRGAVLDVDRQVFHHMSGSCSGCLRQAVQRLAVIWRPSLLQV